MAEGKSTRARSAVFRLDFGGELGWGHLARCAALAAELRGRGWTCGLWTHGDRSSPPAGFLESFDPCLAAGADWPAEPPPAVRAADWLVVDFYGADDAALASLRRAAPSPRLLVIDDLAQRRLDAADLILNTRLGLARPPYAPGVAALLGERFALLRRGLEGGTRAAFNCPSGVEPVLVIFGGTDPRGLTAIALDALAEVGADSFAPVVVRTRGGDDVRRVARALERFSAGAWVGSLDAVELGAWARTCRWAISAAGGTLFELAFLRLPFVAVVVADNQRPFAAEVARRWHLPVVDGAEDVRAALAAGVRQLLALGSEAGAAAFAAIDGRGAARVADAMEAGPA